MGNTSRFTTGQVKLMAALICALLIAICVAAPADATVVTRRAQSPIAHPASAAADLICGAAAEPITKGAAALISLISEGKIKGTIAQMLGASVTALVCPRVVDKLVDEFKTIIKKRPAYKVDLGPAMDPIQVARYNLGNGQQEVQLSHDAFDPDASIPRYAFWEQVGSENWVEVYPFNGDGIFFFNRDGQDVRFAVQAIDSNGVRSAFAYTQEYLIQSLLA